MEVGCPCLELGWWEGSGLAVSVTQDPWLKARSVHPVRGLWEL